MAEFTDRIKLIFDAVTSDAASGVGKLKSGVDEAHGTFGKLKAGASGAFDLIANNAPTSMAAIATAAGTFVAKAISAFQELALSANQFGDATGLAVEDASRWIEVAGDLGVNTETLQGAVNKLNIAASKGALKELGVGGDTTNERLLNALEHLRGIDDATERAKQGMALFGKSWTQLAPLIESAGDLRTALGEVSDAKVIDEAEVEKAKSFRDAMDNLSDVFEEFQLTIGGELIGDVAKFANALLGVKEAADGLVNSIPGMDGGLMGIATGPIRNVTDGFDTLTSSTSSLTDKARGLGQMVTGAIPGPLGSWAGGLFDVEEASDKATESAEANAAAAKAVADAADEATKALETQTNAMLASFNSQLGYANASDKTTEAVGKYNTAAAKATEQSWGNREANVAAEQAMREAESAALGQAAAHVKMAEDMAKANGETLTAQQRNALLANELRTVAGTLAEGSPLRSSLESYATDLEHIPSDVDTTFHVDNRAAIAAIDAVIRKLGQALELAPGVDLLASATSSTSGTQAAPAPAAVSATTGLQTTAAPTALPVATVAPRALAPATTIVNVNVSAPPATNPAEIGRVVADYLDAFYRRSGQRPRAVA